MGRVTEGLIIFFDTTLVNSTLIILFSKMLKFSKNIFFKSKNIVKDNSDYCDMGSEIIQNVVYDYYDDF
jgi:hypothetical protein